MEKDKSKGVIEVIQQMYSPEELTQMSKQTGTALVSYVMKNIKKGRTSIEELAQIKQEFEKYNAHPAIMSVLEQLQRDNKNEE